MAHPILFGGATPPPAKYQIANSIRFRPSASTCLTKTWTGAGSPTWTIAAWVKKTGNGYLFGTSGATNDGDCFHVAFAGDQLSSFQFTQNLKYTAARYRDPSGWLHVVINYDGSSLSYYVNGEQVTAFETYNNNPISTAWNSPQSHNIGRYFNGTGYFDGYMADVHMIDGQSLPPSSFGKFDTNGVWVPIPYSGTYGANGCKLEFKNSGNLGLDTSGNGNHWTVNGLTAADQMADTPSNNHATLNPLNLVSPATLSSGNLTASNSANSFPHAVSTMPVMTKAYWETYHSTDYVGGITGIVEGLTDTPPVGVAQRLGQTSAVDSVGLFATTNQSTWVYRANSTLVYTGSPVSSHVVTNWAYDPASGKLWIGLNGSWIGGGDPAAGTSPTTNMTAGKAYFPCVEPCVGDIQIRFDPGSFSYTPPAGFKALCTANLPAVPIADPKKHFNAVLYTGNGGTKVVSGLGFKPGLLWGKERSTSRSHFLQNEVVGPQSYLWTDQLSVEVYQHVEGYVQSFDPDGFTVTGSSTSALTVNENGGAYVAWAWKGNGSTVTNAAGATMSQVSADPAAGFSIVSYTGSGGATTIGHGLGAVPAMVIAKPRTIAYSWYVFHGGLGGSNNCLYLESPVPVSTVSSDWNNTSPTSAVFSVNGLGLNTSGAPYIAYCFSEIPGYSRFGAFISNATIDNAFVYCGFRPRWLLFKRALNPNGGGWLIYDAARDTINVMGDDLYANTAQAESTGNARFDFTANGFKCRSAGLGVNGDSFIFAAFAEHPFGGSNVSPSPAR